jgi:hypothetical protein
MKVMLAYSRPRVVLHLSIFCLLTFNIVGRSADDDDKAARAILEKAVSKHGGKDRLIALQKSRMKTKGTVFIDTGNVDYTAEIWEELPAREKAVANLKAGDVEQIELRVIDGDNAWRKIDDSEAMVLPKESRREMQNGLYAQYAMTLVPLLQDKGIMLHALGESKLEKKAVLGVRVIAKDRDELHLFFDKETGLLMRCLTRSTTSTGKPAIRDEYLYDYKDYNGVKYPSRSVAFFGGKRLQERLVISIECLDKLDRGMFKKP